ncbi:MAG: serpin family protein [Bacillota bacterium]
MRRLTAAILLALLLAGCGGVEPSAPAPSPPAATPAQPVAEPPSDPKPPAVSQLDGRMAEANIRFSLALLREVHRLKPDESHFLSPASAQVVLSLTAAGAKGETQQAMLQALQYGAMTADEIHRANGDLQTILTNPDPKVELQVANALWHQEQLKPSANFLDVARQHYRAEVSPAHFGTPESAKAINNWAKEKTKGKIPHLLDETNSEDLMILVNAIYFYGNWTRPFTPELTREAPFTRLDGSTKPVKFMHQEGVYRYLEQDGVRGIRLPYGDGRVGLYAIMPDRWDGFVDGLTPERWAQYMDGFGQERIRLAMPRVKLEYKTELIDPLTALGMGIAFRPHQADLTGLFEQRVDDAHISKVLQKTYLDLNERGTEAAAVTAAVAAATSAPADEPKELKLNRPFLLAIRDDQTRTLLFVGTVLEP